MALRPTIERLAARMRRTCPTLRAHEPEDLVQEAYALAIQRLPRFEGRSSLKTWFVSLARNKFIDLSRRAAIRPQPAGDLVLERLERVHHDVEELRAKTLELLAWLKVDGREEIPRGAEILTLLARCGADWERTSVNLTIWTGRPWTVDRIKGTVRLIKATDRGRALCDALGAPDDEIDDEEE